MCGVAGFVEARATDGADALGARLKRMTNALAHRGPDGEGAWVDPRHGVALGHRRLSIIDLSAAGAQPMASASGRWVLSYNGEIYNYRALRAQLEQQAPVAWRGTSDTEVALAWIERHGFEDALRNFTGMFSIALWDREEATLYLARDRLGEKPLYYGWSGDALLFGSELKALRAHPAFRAAIDRDAVCSFLRHSYVPAPLSIYEGIHKLPAATCLRLTAADRAARTLPEPVPYWSATAAALAGQAAIEPASPRDWEDRVEAALAQAVAGQMVSDVPLGAFLSGGIDSSLVVALMQQASRQPVRTFTIGFAEEAFNEAPHAKAVARHLGTEHHEAFVSPDEARAVIPGLPAIYDEPFSDSSQIPTFLVSRLARAHVTVALSGDGGDELFGGYPRYFIGNRLAALRRRLPSPVRHGLAAVADSVPPEWVDRAARLAHPALPARWRYTQAGSKLAKVAQVLRSPDMKGVYESLVSHWASPEAMVVGGREREALRVRNRGEGFEALGFTGWMMLTDTLTYLPDDIMAKVDRASMAVSLETRAPFLDHRVYELAWQLPPSERIEGSHGKRVLKRLLDRHVPRALTDRPKMGFGVPIDSWLRGPLRDWAAALLDPARLRSEGLLDPAPIARAWQRHQEGRENLQYPLWDVLMLQAWLEAQREEPDRIRENQKGAHA